MKVQTNMWSVQYYPVTQSHVLVSTNTMPCSQQSLTEARNDQSQDDIFKETLTDHEPPSHTPTNEVKETMDAEPSSHTSPNKFNKAINARPTIDTSIFVTGFEKSHLRHTIMNV